MLRIAALCLLPAVLSVAASTARGQTVLFSDDFENGTANWTTEHHWHLTDESSPCHDAPFPSGTHCMWYGNEFSCNYEPSALAPRSLRLAAPVALPPSGPAAVLEFWSRTETERDTWHDRRTVEVATNGSGTNWTIVHQVLVITEPWTLHQVDLSPYAGQTIHLRFSFYSDDGIADVYLGWLIDDVVIHTPEVFPTSCFGDVTAAACPCSNSGWDGRGCQNSAFTGGALLTVSGTTHPDTILLQSSGELPSALTIFLQGSASVGPIGFGDGVRCAGGPLKRLYNKNATSGVAIVPSAGDPTVSARSAALGDVLAPGAQRYYQAYYRDPDTNHCPPPQGANFNASQMRRITW